jgi:hypothetical protein
MLEHSLELEGVKVCKLFLKDGSKMTLLDFPAFEDHSPESNAELCQSLLKFTQKYVEALPQISRESV